MKEPKRKVITAEIDTYQSNKNLKMLVRSLFQAEAWRVIQIQVNEIKKEK